MPKDKRKKKVDVLAEDKGSVAERIKREREAKQRRLDLIMGKSQVDPKKKPRN